MVKITEHDGGFFKEFNQKVRDNLTEEQFQNYSNLKSDEDRVSFVYDLDGITDLKIDSSKYRGKNLEKALDLKSQGNIVFQKGQWDQALKLYTESYLVTPEENGKDLSIILANRSATLVHKKEYDTALRDIQMSLQYGYPADLRYKLLERRARCHLALNSHVDALEAFRETLRHLDESKLPQEKRQKMQADVQIMIAILTKSNIKPPPQAKQKQKILPTMNKNKNFPNACDAINIESNTTDGRFARATKDITVGDIVIVEKPYCYALLNDYTLSHCQHCFSKVPVPISCPGCSNVVFCSAKCKQDAIESYHSYECGILNMIWLSGLSITCHLALRAISQSKLQYLLSLKDTLEKELSVPYNSSDYTAVYKLVRHEKTRNSEDFFQRTNLAVFLLRCLKENEYFGTLSNRGNEIYIGGLILRNLQLMQFNAHEISELQKTGPTDPGKSVFLGGGIFPTLALFNHSCDPGLVRYFRGTSVVARAVKNIRSGHLVCENYGPIFTQQAAPERQATLLEQYWFRCTCEPCEKKWPMLKEMDDTIMRFRCNSEKNCQNVILVPVDTNDFMMKCNQCGQFTNILKGLKALQDTDGLFKVALRLQEKGDYKKALLKYIELLKLLDENLAPPFKDFHLCQQGIRVCSLAMGNISFKSI